MPADVQSHIALRITPSIVTFTISPTLASVSIIPYVTLSTTWLLAGRTTLKSVKRTNVSGGMYASASALICTEAYFTCEL